jgi:hypothetical protein
MHLDADPEASRYKNIGTSETKILYPCGFKPGIFVSRAPVFFISRLLDPDHGPSRKMELNIDGNHPGKG